jgi:hypothetical protein
MIIDEQDVYDTDDPWKSTSFSTQNIYHETLNTSIVAIGLLLVAIGVSSIPFFKEECGQGFYEFTKDGLSNDDGKKWLSFV